jgi:hypothetical protein
MLQMFCQDVAKIDLDVTYTCMLQAYVSKILGALYLCLQVFHLDVAYVYNCFKCFSDVFISVSGAYFKCFIYFFLYVATIASGCFKSRLGVAHGIRVASSQ